MIILSEESRKYHQPASIKNQNKGWKNKDIHPNEKRPNIVCFRFFSMHLANVRNRQWDGKYSVWIKYAMIAFKQYFNVYFVKS